MLKRKTAYLIVHCGVIHCLYSSCSVGCYSEVAIFISFRNKDMPLNLNRQPVIEFCLDSLHGHRSTRFDKSQFPGAVQSLAVCARGWRQQARVM